MENWQLKYLGEQLLKLPRQKYQIALTGLFLYDEDLIAYQPKIEHTVTVGVGKKRIDLYYESCKLAIEIDEPFHKRNLEDDKKREQEISKEIPGIHFERIDIVEENWFEKYLEIKKKILENKIIMPWLESDVVPGFKKLNGIKTKEIGDQIKFISKHLDLFENRAYPTSTEKYSGVYINQEKNETGKFYIGVVNYNQNYIDTLNKRDLDAIMKMESDLSGNNSKISFVVFDKKIISDHSTTLINSGNWIKANRTLECILKQFEINQDYINKSKEEQFQLLKEFINENFKEIHKLKKRSEKQD